MPVKFVYGDLFSDPADALVNPVNCVGVMGAGLALAFRERYPRYYAAYAECCRRGAIKPGSVHLYPTRMAQPKYLISFPTKRHWRERSRMEDIESGLKALRHALADGKINIRSVAVPALGAGLGGLEWPRIKKRIEAVLSEIPGVDVRVYAPHIARPAAAPEPAAE